MITANIRHITSDKLGYDIRIPGGRGEEDLGRRRFSYIFPFGRIIVKGLETVVKNAEWLLWLIYSVAIVDLLRVTNRVTNRGKGLFNPSLMVVADMFCMGDE